MTYLERFTEATKGLRHVSTGGWLSDCEECRAFYPDDEDYEDCGVHYGDMFFSWSRCDTCNSDLGGDREVGHAFTDDGTMIHLYACVDCVVHLANGELPDETT